MEAMTAKEHLDRSEPFKLHVFLARPEEFPGARRPPPAPQVLYEAPPQINFQAPPEQNNNLEAVSKQEQTSEAAAASSSGGGSAADAAERRIVPRGGGVDIDPSLMEVRKSSSLAFFNVWQYNVMYCLAFFQEFFIFCLKVQMETKVKTLNLAFFEKKMLLKLGENLAGAALIPSRAERFTVNHTYL